MVPEQLLKTSEVAKLLGLSVATVKRLVDSGRLRASRTMGRHRLVPASEVERYRRRMEVGSVVGGEEPSVLPLRPTVEGLLKALKRGDELTVQQMIAQASDSGMSVAELGDDLVRTVMERLGQAWEHAELDIYEEHRASRILESALIGQIRRLGPAAVGAPRAMGCSPAGDLYTLSGLLCELALREQGWNVQNLGANLPLSSLTRAVRENQPRLVWITLSHVSDPASFVEDYRRFYESISGSGAAVVLGGSALSPELRSRVVAASFGDRLSHLCAFARSLVPPVASTRVGSNVWLDSRNS